MSKLTLKELEGYLVSEDLEDFFSKMPPRSESVSYLKLMTRLHTPDVSFEDFKKVSEEFIKNKKYSQNLKKKVKIILTFKKLERAQENPIETKKVLNDLNSQLFNFNFSYKKPKQVETENIALDTFGEDNYKQLEEQKLLHEHLDLVKELNENLTYSTFSKVDPDHFFRNFNMGAVDLSSLCDQLFNSFVEKAFEGFGLSYKGMRQFLLNFAKLSVKKLSHVKYYFLNQVHKYPLAWLEDVIQVGEWKSDETFLKAYIAKKFKVMSMESEDISLEQLESIKEFAGDLDPKFNLMKKYCDFQILKKKLDRGSPDKEAFKKYLENPLFEKTTSDSTRFEYQVQTEMKMSNQKRLKIKTEKNILPGSWVSGHESVVDQHLEAFFKAGDGVDEWTPYLNEKYLKRLFFRVNLCKGELPEGFDEILSEEEVKALTNKKNLEFIDGNKKRFLKGDKVEMRLKLKNIQELKIKIFQINIESALLENQDIDFAKMDLLGLVAREELSYTYNRPPLEVWEESFHFDSMDTIERGVFIVDFITGRVSSRAVIHKGSLGLIYEKQKLGTLCWILDENKKVCTGSRTGVYIGRKFFASDKQGQIHVPFNISSKPSQVIACHENFAVTASLEVRDPQLNLLLEILFNSEQLRAGHRTSFFLVPDLTLFNKPLSMENLVDPKLVVNLSGELGNRKRIEIPKKDLNLRNGKFFEVSLNFLPKTTSISFNLSGRVALHNKEERALSVTKSLSFLPSTSRPLEQVYLTGGSEQGRFCVQVRGRNGELRKNQEFDLNLTRRGPRTKGKSGILNVNSEGVKELGKLEKVERVQVNLTSRITKPKTYVQDTQTEYSSKVLMTCNDQLRIPVFDPTGVRVFKCLIDEQQLQVSSGWNDKNILSENNELVEKSGDNEVSLSNLEEGAYLMMIPNKTRRNPDFIGIRVIEGKRFSLFGKSFVEWKNSYIHTPSDTRFTLLMAQNEATNNSEHVCILTGGLEQNSGKKTFAEDDAPKKQGPEAQTLFVCSNFLNHENHGLLNGNQTGLHHRSFDQSFSQSFSNNNYFSNKMLDEEIIYVLQRRKMPEFMGNTLDKPSMLLKRKKVQATTNENLQLQKETDFAKLGAARSMSSRQAQRLTSRAAIIHETMDLSYDFLEKPGKIIQGEGLTEDGRVQVPEEAKAFNNVKCVMMVDGKIMLSRTVREAWSEPARRNQSLDESKKVGYVYRNIRLVNALVRDKTYTIDNVSNTEFWSLNTTEQLMKAFETIKPKFAKELKEWEFLGRWNSMKPAEKLKTYDKFYSHELNMFVYFKDREFFDEVVMPFISNKKQKTFVDLFLLDMKAEARKYLKVSNADCLINQEKLLLFLMFWEEEETSSLVEALHGITSLPQNRVVDGDFKTIFENLLNSRKTEEGKDKGDAAPVEPGMAPAPPRLMLAQGYNQRARVDRAPRRMQIQNRAPRRMQNRAIRRRNEEQMLMQLERQASVGDFEDEAYDFDVEEEGMFEESFRDHRRTEQKFREAGAKVYQPMESTAEYVEKEYFYNSDRVRFTDNNFYFHLAEHIIRNKGSTKNFVDKNFLYCTSSVTEMLFVVTMMDLDFDFKETETQVEGQTMVAKAKQNCVFFSKEISEAKGKQMDIDFLVSQRFYDPNDRYTLLDDGTEVEKPVKEFVKGRVYGCRVVVTNSTVSDQSISVITEVPQGSIALQPGDSLKVHYIRINSFLSHVIDLTFYFPSEGEFTVYPATVAKEESILATAKEGVRILVKPKKETIELESISDVLSTGKIENIVAFLRDKNLQNNAVFQFSNIGWLMKNPEFYNQVVSIFREKGIFNQNIWKFSVYHGDLVTFRELLLNAFVRTNFKSHFFFLKNQFLTFENCQPKDYFPLINPRAHSLGENEANIMNKQFRETYKNFLLYLVEKGGPSLEDRVLWVTYLLLQDRVHEASQMFGKFGPEDRKALQTSIQFDYIEAYIDFMTGFPTFARARAVCEEYLDYPVLGWRNLFVEIANQLSEYQETELASTALLDQTKANKQKNADLTPYLAAEMAGSRVKVSFRNQSKVHLEFYRIDLEVLFTQDPFESKLNSSLTNVIPFLSQSHSVTKQSDFQVAEYALPETLHTENLLIRVLDDSKQSHLLKFIPFKLESILNEEYGILKLIDKTSNRPVPKVYVKCFAKMASGQVRFFKDGYTDLRGSFDFASMNTSGASKAKQFCLLVLSREHGSKVLHSKPPVSTMRVEGKAKKIKSKNYRGMREKRGFKKMKYQLSDYEEE